MSDGADYDVSGHWTGVFNFPRLLPPGGFEATLREVGGAISGVTIEPGDPFDPPGTILEAVIKGGRDQNLVTFRKIYDDELRPDAVFYQGVIQQGGDEIRGEWTIPGEWSGTFLIVRAGKEEAEVKRRVSEEV